MNPLQIIQLIVAFAGAIKDVHDVAVDLKDHPLDQPIPPEHEAAVKAALSKGRQAMVDAGLNPDDLYSN